MVALASATDVMTWDEHMARMRSAGFRWHRTDAVVISQDAAQVAINSLDEHIATAGVSGDTLTDAIQARDELQAAICRATEAG